MIRHIDKHLYTASTHTTGGREGTAASSDGALDVRLSPPGSGGTGTNPEQLFAAGYSACFIGAMRRAAAALGIALPNDVSVDADVALGTTTDNGFALAARLAVTLPGLTDEQKRAVVDGAHQICPYSHATRGNIQVDLAVN